jgi:hypothetical protein
MSDDKLAKIDPEKAKRVIDSFSTEADIERIAWRLDMPEEEVRAILSNPAVGGEAVRQKALSFGPELVGTLLDRLLVLIKNGEPQHTLSAGRLMLQIYKDIGTAGEEKPAKPEDVVVNMTDAIILLESEEDGS